jgi:hypothetical protein
MRKANEWMEIQREKVIYGVLQKKLLDVLDLLVMNMSYEDEELFEQGNRSESSNDEGEKWEKELQKRIELADNKDLLDPSTRFSIVNHIRPALVQFYKNTDKDSEVKLKEAYKSFVENTLIKIYKTGRTQR